MKSLKSFHDLESHRESDEKYEDIQNSIQNSLLYNEPANRYNYYDFLFNDCFWIVPFGITLVMIIIVMIITVILVKTLS